MSAHTPAVEALMAELKRERAIKEELLSALQDIVGQMPSYENQMRARAAIAKATRGQS